MSATQLKRGALIVVGALVVVAAAVGITTLVSPDRGAVTGLFADANTLVVGNTVRSGGVQVGRVASLDLEGGHARVGLEVDRNVLPLTADATMRIRAVNVLGEKYIDLSPGTPGAPELADQVVPLDRTSVAVDVQDVIDGLGDPTATGLATVVTTVGEGIDGQGRDLSGLVRNLDPAFTQTDRVARILREQNAALNAVVDQVRPVTASLSDGDGATLDRLVGNTERTLSAVAAERQALDATLAQLPDTLVSARRTLGELAGTADAATPTLKALRPTTDQLPQISKELHDFADAADPALSSLRPVLDRADQLLNEAAPVVKELRATGPDLRSAAKNLRPIGDQALDKQLKGVLDFVKLWAMSTNGKDGLSHYFRGVATATPENLLNLIGGAVPAPLVPGAPSSAATAPGTGLLPKSVPGAPAAGAKGRPAGLPVPPPATAPGNATGMTEQQEQSMVGQLLGGQ